MARKSTTSWKIKELSSPDPHAPAELSGHPPEEGERNVRAGSPFIPFVFPPQLVRLKKAPETAEKEETGAAGNHRGTTTAGDGWETEIPGRIRKKQRPPDSAGIQKSPESGKNTNDFRMIRAIDQWTRIMNCNTGEKGEYHVPVQSKRNSDITNYIFWKMRWRRPT